MDGNDLYNRPQLAWACRIVITIIVVFHVLHVMENLVTRSWKSQLCSSINEVKYFYAASEHYSSSK